MNARTCGQIEDYGASTQATAEVIALDGDDEAEAIGRAMQTLSETALGDAVGASVQDISTPVVRLILSNGGDDTCAAAYWGAKPGVTFTVALRLLVSVSFSDVDAETEAALTGGLATLLYTASDSVRFESLGRAESNGVRSDTQTDVVLEVAATSETNALRIAELMLTQADEALTVAVGAAVSSFVPTVRNLLVETASATSAALPSPPPPPAATDDGSSVWPTAGVVIGAIAGMSLLGCIVICVLRSPRAHKCLGGKRPNNILEAGVPGQVCTRHPTASEMTSAGVPRVLISAGTPSPGTAAHVTATRGAGGLSP